MFYTQGLWPLLERQERKFFQSVQFLMGIAPALSPYRIPWNPYRWIVMTHEAGASYDYRTQEWREFHDHYHVGLNVGAGHGWPERGYCGADVGTCQKLPR